MVELGARLIELGFSLIATRGTQKCLEAAGIELRAINKVLEGRPHIVDAIKNGEIALVFNTTEGTQAIADSLSLRQATLLNKTPYCTTLAASRAMVLAIASLKMGPLEAHTLQSYSS